jgi:hypothetical protein
VFASYPSFNYNSVKFQVPRYGCRVNLMSVFNVIYVDGNIYMHVCAMPVFI